MRTLPIVPVLWLASRLWLGCGLSAQQPTIVHAQLETQSAGHGLVAELQTLERSAGPLWIGYSVPTIAPFQGYGQGTQTAYLEREESYHGATDRVHTQRDRATILLRIDHGRVEQLRAEAPDRTVDAGNLRFVWLPDVTPQDSVATLLHLATTLSDQQLRRSAVFLLSQHESPAAVPALVQLSMPAEDLGMREQATFWLSTARGHEGFVAVQYLARTDADAALREKLTFDLTLGHDREALPELIRMAHDDPAPQVRRQAQFWMAQQASKGDATLIADKLRQSSETDPDEETRRHAVFALTQLPQGRAFDELSRVASTSNDAAVRRQAVFWLGQSPDPRAVDYLARLLRGSTLPGTEPGAHR